MLVALLALSTAGGEPPATALSSAPAAARAKGQDGGPGEVQSLVQDATAAYQAGDYAEAARLGERALAIARDAVGPDHLVTLTLANNVGLYYQAQGRYAEAERLFRLALDGITRTAGADHPNALSFSSNLALVYQNTGRFALAEPIARQVAATAARTLGPDNPATLVFLANLGQVQLGLGRVPEAVRIFEEVVRTRQRAFGPDDPDTIGSLNTLALAYQTQGRFAEAERLYREAQEGLADRLGPDHPNTLAVTSNLAGLNLSLARAQEAERLQRQVLATRERVLGPTHPDTLTSVGALAIALDAQGRAAEAEPLLIRALETSQQTLGRENPSTLGQYTSLGLHYLSQSRSADAEPLLRHVLDTAQRTLGRDHPTTLLAANNLAVLYEADGRSAEASALLQRVVDDTRRTQGRGTPNALPALVNLARSIRRAGRPADAERVQREALAETERLLGPDNPNTIAALVNVAELAATRGRTAEAETAYRRVYETSLRVLGPDHPNTLTAARDYIAFRLPRPGGGDAMAAPARVLADGTRRRRQNGRTDQRVRAVADRDRASASERFALVADVAWQSSGGPTSAATRAETFAALQDSLAGTAARSIAEQAARRYATGRNAALAGLIRERLQLEAEWSRLDEMLAMSLGGPADAGAERPAAIRARLQAVQARVAAIDTRLRSQAPDYFALVEPAALDVAGAQALLGPDEALLLAVPSRFGTHAMLVTRDRIEWRRSVLTAERLGPVVRRLRYDLGAEVEGTAAEIAALQASRPANARMRFDRAAAFSLYQELVAPFAAALAGRQTLYVAAGGALAGLPFSVLVTAAPTGADDDAGSLRGTRWLGDDIALAHIPTVQSLALLRRGAAARGADGFVGVGDPVLGGATSQRGPGATRGIGRVTAQRAPAGLRTREGRPLAEIAELRQLPRLPGTAVELEAVRQVLGAPRTSLLMGARATEPGVRRANLSRGRIILFSTHGLTARQASGVGEAGLVLTPPAQASEEDDGYLAASEVTTLDLNAEWVILSACNTASGDGSEDPGLGALSRAFFYAGARNLLASHWPVSDDVAPALITRTLALQRSGTPRAQALRTAMREVRMDASHDGAEASWAHPFFWAPFVLVGEGNR